MMTKFEDDYKKTMSPNRTFSYYTQSWHDSEFESNAISLLKLLRGIHYHEQGLVFSVPFLPGGRYKPDAWYSMQPRDVTTIGTAKVPLAIGEFKGFKGKEGVIDTNELKRRFMASLVDDPGDEVCFAWWQMKDSKGILGYDGVSREWEPAAIYVCPCGGTFYAVKTRRTCPYCRNANPKFVTDQGNGEWTRWWHKVSEKTIERMSEQTEMSIRPNGKSVWDEVITEMEQEYQAQLRDFDGIKPDRAPIPDTAKGVDWKELVRDAYTEGEDHD